MANLRSNLIRLASSMPKGSSERKALLSVLAENKGGTSTKKASAYNYKGVGIADPTLVGLFVTAHRRAEECMDTLKTAHKRVHALVKKIEADMQNLKGNPAFGDDPWADDKKSDDLKEVLNAAESLQELLDGEIESYSSSRIQPLVEDLNIEGILR